MSKKVIISVGITFIIQNKNSETTDSSSSIRQMISDGPVVIGSKENDVVAHGKKFQENKVLSI